MYWRVSHITHTLCFVLGCSFTLLLTSYQIKEQDLNDVFERDEFDLIALILSAPSNFNARQTIRETWASDLGDRSQYMFAIGSMNVDKFNYTALKKEQSFHGDILLLPVHESYASLTKKVLAAFVHVFNTYKFKFVLKVDDDSFVNVNMLIKALKLMDSNSLIYWGYFNGRAPVFKKGKWKEDDWFLCDRYLPYALGGGYILSYPAVQYITNNAHLFSTYKSEDVSVGTWLSPLNMTRKHDIRFDTGHISRGCQNSHLVTHKQSPELMKAFHSSLRQSGKQCNVEMEISKPYVYDWHLPPSKCCLRLSI